MHISLTHPLTRDGNNITKLSRDFFAAVTHPRFRNSINSWNIKHINGAIKYHSSTGLIEVEREGYYYVYSQMYYFDGSTDHIGHSTYIYREKVMESTGSVISAERKYNTKYHGGIFLLQKRDIISVRVAYNVRFFMDGDRSFFGAFLIKNTAIKGEQKHF